MPQEWHRFALFRHDPNARDYQSGTVIFAQGTPGAVMYAIKSGSVAIEVDGHRVETLGPEEIFGEMALLEDEPRSATAVALVDTELVEIDRTKFYLLVRQNPHFALQLMRVLSDRLRQANALATR